MEGEVEVGGVKEETVAADTAVLDHLEKIGSTFSSQSVKAAESQNTSAQSDSGLKPPNANLNKPGDRLSLSSLYSLGSVIYNGTTGLSSAPPSATSSVAGSVKSGGSEQPTPTPISPSLGSAKGDAASMATTATDPVSVNANSQPLHQGSEFTRNRSCKNDNWLTTSDSASQHRNGSSILRTKCCY